MATGTGLKRERIRFVRQAKTRRADGGYDVLDTTVAERWAHVRPVQSNEQEQSGRMRGAVTYIIELARTDGLTTEDAIVWLTRDSVRLNIREIRTDGMRPIDMEIVAQSGVVQ
jgi:head-tail adaptor